MRPSMETKKRVVGDYVLTQQIGVGSFAVVWKAKHRHTGAEVAIKEIPYDKLNPKLAENLFSEINILKKTNHPNIIRLYDTISTSNRIFLVLEFCAGGDLAGYIQRHGRVSEGAARHFMRQLGAGLQVLQANNLIHRDLKPQNLLLSAADSGAVLKIADFGFARSLQPQGMAETLCGSPLYMAPEILQSKKYDAKADLWSVGTILYQLVTGQPPFVGQNPYQLLQNIQKSTELLFPKSVYADLHPECIDLCRKLLRKDPVQRLSFEEFFNHSFVADSARNEHLFHSTRENPPSSSDSKSFHDEPMPFLLDEDNVQAASPLNLLRGSDGRGTPGKKDVLSRERSSSSRTVSSGVHHPTDANFKAINPTANEGLSLTSHSKSAIMDSMEILEKEYVLVSIPVTSTDAISLTASDQFTCIGNLSPGKCPQKATAVNRQPPKGGSLGVVTNTEGLEASHGLRHSTELHGVAVSLAHHVTRLRVLQKCAKAIADLANDKYTACQYLEAFSTQLVCLAVWKEALSCSSKREGPGSRMPARGESESSKLFFCFLNLPEDDIPVEALSSHIEREFNSAVEQAEGFSPHLQSLDGNTEMPDAVEIIFEAALAIGRNAGVDELMGNLANAAVGYAKAATLLYFLLAEAVSLPISPRLVLSHADKQRLRSYIEMLLSRQRVCSHHKMDPKERAL